MNRAKQLFIAVLCECHSGHDLYKDVLMESETADQLLNGIKITKSDLFSETQDGDSIFKFREVWAHLDRLVDLIRKNGEEFTAEDFRQMADDKKSILEMAIDKDALNRLFSEHLWANRLTEMEDLWYEIPKSKRDGFDFRDARREVAALAGKELREDQLEKMEIHPGQMINALRIGSVEEMQQKLAKHGDHIRTEDILLLDSDGCTSFSIAPFWEHFGKICRELQAHGEILTADDFMFSRGGAKAPLEKAFEMDVADKLFHPLIWQDRLDEMLDLFEKGPASRFDDIDIFSVISDIMESGAGGKMKSVKDWTASLDKKMEYNNRPVRALGMKNVWKRMDAIRQNLRQNGEKFTLAHLRLSSAFKDETVMLTAVRFGYFEQVQDILKESGEHLSYDDIAMQGADGRTMLDLLMEQNELPSLFQPENWIGRAQELFKTWEDVPDHERSAVDFADIHSKVNLLSLRQHHATRHRPQPRL